MPLKIERMYAFVAIDEHGDEGIPAFSHGPMMLPMVGADMTRIESMRTMAQNIANTTGQSMRLVIFEKREELDWITPRQK